MEKEIIKRKSNYNLFAYIAYIIATVCFIVGLIMGSVMSAKHQNSAIFLMFVVFAVGFAALGTLILFYKPEIIVTDKSVNRSVSFLGMKSYISLPLNQISSIKRTKFKSLSVGTSSKRIRFSFLEDYREVFGVIKNLLAENQNQ